MSYARSSLGLGLTCGPPPAVLPGARTQSSSSSNANPWSGAITKVLSQAQYQSSMKAYHQSLSSLNPSWQLLPVAPYPPMSDPSTNFPRTGSPSLRLSPSSVSAAALAEPGKITQNQRAVAEAHLPALGWGFFVGAACLAGYFYLR